MKLLICTQVVDSSDSNLGFFVRWIEEFAKHYEQVTVICLRKGKYNFASHVRVFELGQGTKVTRAYKLLKGVYKFRNNYDTVLVHMNPEYLVVAGWLWRMLGKKIGLWYTHKSVDLKLRVAAFFTNIIFTASKESFRLASKKVHVMGHGIDTDFFAPDLAVIRGNHFLSAGRLMLSKRHDLAIRVAHERGRSLCVVGEGPERASLEALAHELGVDVVFLGGLSHTGVRDEYRKASLFLHMSETGSLDKMVLEALATGLPIETRDPALKFLESKGREYVQKSHSLPHLISALAKELA